MARRRSSSSPTDVLLNHSSHHHNLGDYKNAAGLADSESAGECDLEQERPQRNAANARERARMRVLSRAFCRLKTTLPWVPPDTKLSKLDTLRLATSYIDHLTRILHGNVAGGGPSHQGVATGRGDGSGGECSTTSQGHGHPTISAHLSLSWPFTFQQPSTILTHHATETEMTTNGGYSSALYSFGDSLVHNN